MTDRRSAFVRLAGIITIVSLVCLILPAGSLADSGTWRGEYFNSTNLSGSPVLVRQDASISFDWGYGSPDSAVNSNKFSVRWVRTLNLEAGTYLFNASTDDGVRVYVDGMRIIDAWYDQELPNERAGQVALAGGYHTVVVEYYEYKGLASAHFWWKKLTGATGWIGSYYTNPDLEGDPALVREDRSISFNWGSGSPAPGMPADYFSARWIRLQNFSPGYYRLTVTATGGVRVLLSGQRVIDQWDPQGSGTYNLDDVFLNGSRELQVLYRSGAGSASVSFSAIPSGKPLPPPADRPNVPPAWRVPISCVSGPLEVEAWPINVMAIENTLGFEATIYVGARGGDCTYTYLWEGRVVGGPTHESLAFRLTTPTWTSMVGKLTVKSGGQVASIPLYVAPPAD
jgi:hypothetical protein